jgi:transposase InsO family protein
MPVANTICERVIGTLRRECLDCVMPLNDRHLYRILKQWVAHYNEGRPHMALGPGIPQPRPALPVVPQAARHLIPMGQRVVARSVLSGLHHDYGLEKQAA